MSFPEKITEEDKATMRIYSDDLMKVSDISLRTICNTITDPKMMMVCNSDGFWVKKIGSVSTDLISMYSNLTNPTTPRGFYDSLVNLGLLYNNIIYPMEDKSRKGYFIIDSNLKRSFPILVFDLVEDGNKVRHFSLIPDMYIYEFMPDKYRQVKFPRNVKNIGQVEQIMGDNSIYITILGPNLRTYLEDLTSQGFIQIEENLDKIGQMMIDVGQAHPIYKDKGILKSDK